MTRWLTEHRFALTDVLSRLAQHPLSVVLNIMVVAIALALPLLGFVVLNNLKPLTAELASDPEISVFMAVDASRADARALAAPLAALPDVNDVHFVPREQALAELETRPGMAELLSALPGNPLPDAWVVRVSLNGPPGSANGRQQQLAAAISAMPKVDHVQIDAVWVERMEALVRLTSLGLSLIAAALAVAVVAVIFNTIRLQVLTQREEIELAKLIGATNRFVRRPFYYMGVLQGFAGGVIALALVALLLIPMNSALADLAHLYVTSFHLGLGDPRLLAAFIVTSSALGFIAALLSVGRHLRNY
jgi:cell division transport system permease protein